VHRVKAVIDCLPSGFTGATITYLYMRRHEPASPDSHTKKVLKWDAGKVPGAFLLTLTIETGSTIEVRASHFEDAKQTARALSGLGIPRMLGFEGQIHDPEDQEGDKSGSAQ